MCCKISIYGSRLLVCRFPYLFQSPFLLYGYLYLFPQTNVFLDSTFPELLLLCTWKNILWFYYANYKIYYFRPSDEVLQSFYSPFSFFLSSQKARNITCFAVGSSNLSLWILVQKKKVGTKTTTRLILQRILHLHQLWASLLLDLKIQQFEF